MTSLNKNFVKTTFPQCNRFTEKNNFCCGDNKTNTEFLSKECNPYQSVSRKSEFADLVLNVLKHARLIYKIVETKKMARDYYNKHKHYCTTLNVSEIQGGSGKIDLYLNSECEVTNQNLNQRTFVTRLVAGLPTLWACTAPKTPQNLKTYNFCPHTLVPLTENEKRIQYYMKHSNFLVNLLYTLKNSIYTYANNREYCKVFNVPAKFSSNGQHYRVKLTGKELKMLYCLYLRGQGAPQNRLLPYKA